MFSVISLNLMCLQTATRKMQIDQDVIKYTWSVAFPILGIFLSGYVLTANANVLFFLIFQIITL